MFFAKLALFILYYRIFALNRWTKIAIYSGIILTGLFYLASSIALIVLCIPRRNESWTSMTNVTRCERAEVMGDVQGIFGLASDLYIFILPLPVLFRLQMSLKKKLGITAIFLTGFIGIVASSIGLYFRVPESNNSDLTWNEPPAAGLAVVEAAIGVVCGSVPHLPAFFRRHSPKFSRVTHLLQELRSSYRIRSKKSYEKQPHSIRKYKPKEKISQKLQVETEILGSIQEEGKFLKSGRFSRIWGNQSSTEHPGSETLIDNTSSTRRDYYELTEHSHQGSKLETITGDITSDGLSQLPAHKKEGPVEATASEQSSRQGYWDIMSIFRSTNKDTTNQSKTYPRSQSSHP
ncbi:hypothetical protein ABVK25_008856 [Lepraria finkii]|uniref:Rhodopsin domain-containing protein n=1 Tax=Lepraria finkii TaxID=1340010 RepID=A0ABR4B159_9LECA